MPVRSASNDTFIVLEKKIFEIFIFIQNAICIGRLLLVIQKFNLSCQRSLLQ